MFYSLGKIGCISWNRLQAALTPKIGTYTVDQTRPYWIWQQYKGNIFHMDGLFLNNFSSILSTNRLSSCIRHWCFSFFLSLSFSFLPPTTRSTVIVTAVVAWILSNQKLYLWYHGTIKNKELKRKRVIWTWLWPAQVCKRRKYKEIPPPFTPYIQEPATTTVPEARTPPVSTVRTFERAGEETESYPCSICHPGLTSRVHIVSLSL